MKLITKGQLWLLLGDKAMNFASFLNKTDPADPLTTMAKNLKVMWDSTEAFDWDSDLMTQQLIPFLLGNAIIDQAAVDRCAAYAAALDQPKTF